jgi:hypothetical protein
MLPRFAFGAILFAALAAGMGAWADPTGRFEMFPVQSCDEIITESDPNPLIRYYWRKRNQVVRIAQVLPRYQLEMPDTILRAFSGRRPEWNSTDSLRVAIRDWDPRVWGMFDSVTEYRGALFRKKVQGLPGQTFPVVLKAQAYANTQRGGNTVRDFYWYSEQSSLIGLTFVASEGGILSPEMLRHLSERLQLARDLAFAQMRKVEPEAETSRLMKGSGSGRPLQIETYEGVADETIKLHFYSEKRYGKHLEGDIFVFYLLQTLELPPEAYEELRTLTPRVPVSPD